MFEAWKEDLMRKHFDDEKKTRGGTILEKTVAREPSSVKLFNTVDAQNNFEHVRSSGEGDEGCEIQFLNEDGWESEKVQAKDCGLNVCSIILICRRDFFYQEPLWGKRAGGGAMWKGVWDWLVTRAELRALKWWGHSSVANQVRVDFIFESGEMAASFQCEVKSSWEELRLPTAVNRRTFLYTEQAFGVGLEPMLSEEDLLSMTSQAQQLFRFFIKCEVVEEGGKIWIRFNNLSDLNLFLYNKVKLADRRTLGTLRQYVTSRRFRCDDSGQFRLFSRDLEKRNPLVPIESLTPEVAFQIKELEVDGKKEGTFLSFANKLDLFKFFISEDAKTIQYLDIDPGLIEEIDMVEDGDSCFKKETSPWGVEVVEEELLRRNVESFNSCQYTQMALQERLVNEKRMGEMELCRLENRVEMLPKHSILSLQQILSLEFLGEQDKGQKDMKKPYPLLLANFLSSSSLLLGVEEAEGEVRFRCVEQDELMKGLREVATNQSAKLEDGGRQRASLKLDPIIDGYEVLIELEEKGLLMSSITEVEEKLKRLSSHVVPRPNGFSVLFPSLRSLLETLLVSRTLFQHHSAKISRRNLLFYSASRNYFCNSPCLTEQELICIAESSSNRKKKKSVAEALTKILSSHHVKGVEEDWEGNLVGLFREEDDVEKLLKQFGCSRESLRDRIPTHRLQAVNQVYCIDCGQSNSKDQKRVDVRDFFPHDSECKFYAGSRLISSASRGFLGRVLSDSSLRSAYPSMRIATENVERSR